MAGQIVFFVGIFLLGITNGKTTRAQVPGCSEPCSACKNFTEGNYKGSWNLLEKSSPRCPGMCLYQKDGEEMCFCDPGPIVYESCEHKFWGAQGGAQGEGNQALVVIGGDNQPDGLLNSADIITSSGICSSANPRKIPPLLHKIAAGGLAWINSDNTNGTLVFCGGSQTFVPGTFPIKDYGASSSCFSVKPGEAQWSTVALCGTDGCGPNRQNDMTSPRSWFSLTSVSPTELIAVGGLNTVGAISKTIEMYSATNFTWAPFKTPELANPRFGHCAVHYSTGANSYLILIGGSQKVSSDTEWFPLTTVEQIDLDTGVISTLNNLPVALWRPACTVSNGFIYVSGGSTGSRRQAASGVYRYSFSTKTWSPSAIGNLNSPRWGHVMGTTQDGAPGQLVVAGGYDPSTSTYYNSIERSNTGGSSWHLKGSLNQAKEYAAVVAADPDTFTCA